MAKLTNFSFCKINSTTTEDEKQESIIPLDILNIDADEFSLKISLTVCDYRINKNHFCKIDILDPQEQSIFVTDDFLVHEETHGEVDKGKLVAGFTLGILFSNLPFRGSGIYSVHVYFDNEHLSTHYLPVTFSKEGE